MREEIHAEDFRSRELPAELRPGQPGAAVPTSPDASSGADEGQREPDLAPASEDAALSQLKNRDLAPDAIEEISRNSGLMKSRKVRLAMASHPRTPRRLALRVIRELYTFELMQFALGLTAAADLRRVADELLLARLTSITLGERIALARRSSEVVAGGLLLDKEKAVWQAALENPRLTEAAVVRALQRSTAMPAFVEAVSHHAKWSVRTEIRIALLRSAYTPLGRALEFAHRLRPAQLRDILHTSRLPEKIKQCLRKMIEAGPKEQGAAARE